MANIRNPIDDLLKRRGLSRGTSSTYPAKQVSNYKTRLTNAGYDPKGITDTRNPLEKALNLEEDQNVLFDIFEIINRPQNALLTGINNAMSGDSFTEGLKEGITGETKTTGKDILVDQLGMEDEAGKLDASDVLGFGLDIVTDPLDYLLLPVGAAGKVSKVAKGVDTAIGAAQTASKAANAIDTASDVAKAVKWVPANQALFNYAGGAIKKVAGLGDKALTGALKGMDALENARVTKLAGGADKVDDFLRANDLVGKVGNRAQNYASLKKGITDVFNQGKTALGKLKLSKRTAQNQNKLLDSLFSKQLDDLDSRVNDFATRRLGTNATQEALEAERNKIWEDMLNYIESGKDTSIKGRNILNQLEKGYTLEADKNSINQLKDILDNISEQSGRKIEYTTDFARDRFLNELSDSTLSQAEKDALLRQGNRLTIDNIDDLNSIKNNSDVQKMFDNAEFKYDLKYNADEQAYIDSLKNDKDFVDFMESTKGTQNELNRIIKESTGLDFGEILNREGYARRARGDIADIQSRIKAIDDQLVDTTLPEETRAALEGARQDLQNMEKAYDGTSNPFKGRKYNQPALVANREMQEQSAKNISNIEQRIADLQGRKYDARKSVLGATAEELKSAKAQIQDIKKGLSSINKEDLTGAAAKYQKLSDRIQKITNRQSKLSDVIDTANKKQAKIVGSINDDLINKAINIKDKSVSKNLITQTSKANDLVKQQNKLLKQLDNIDNLDTKQIDKLEKQVDRLGKNILENNAKLNKTKTIIDNSITNTVEKELDNTAKSLIKFEDQVKLKNTSTIKRAELTELEGRLTDSLNQLEVNIDNALQKTNFDLKGLANNDDIIEKQIASLAKSKSILESEAGKQLFNLNYRAGLEDFVKNAEYTNKTSRLFKDALMTGVFNDRDTFKLAQDVTEQEARNLVKLNGDKLSNKLQNVSHFITDDKDAIGTLINDLKGKEFYVDPRVANMFQRVTGGANETRSFLNVIDKLNTTFKKFSTLTPGFQVRNIVGNSTNMYLSGVPATSLIPYQAKATKVMNSMEDILNKVARGVDLTDVERTNYNLIKQFYEGGFNRAGTAVRDLEKVQRAAQLGGKGPINAATRLNTRANEWVDGMQRMALLMYANDHSKYVAKLGVKTPIEAVKYALMDPSNMSEVEQNVIKKLIPFYTFTKQNLMFQATNMGKNLPRYTKLIKALNDSYNDLDENSYYDYQKNNMQIPLPFLNDDGSQMFLKANLPLSDLGEMLSSPLQRTVSSMTPLIKTPFEMVSGVNTFTGEPVNYSTGKNFANALGITLPEGVESATQTAEHLLNGLGLQNVSSNLVRKVAAAIDTYNGEKTGTELWSEILRSIVQNVKSENVINSGLYDDLETYQAYIKQLKNQGIDIPTMTEINKANKIKLRNLKNKRANL